jgi:hypothetical protein
LTYPYKSDPMLRSDGVVVDVPHRMIYVGCEAR